MLIPRTIVAVTIGRTYGEFARAKNIVKRNCIFHQMFSSTDHRQYNVDGCVG